LWKYTEVENEKFHRKRKKTAVFIQLYKIPLRNKDFAHMKADEVFV